MDTPRKTALIRRLVRTAAVSGLLGSLCSSVYFLQGFTPLSLGVGIFLGIPLLLAAMLLCIVAILSDLRQRGAL